MPDVEIEVRDLEDAHRAAWDPLWQAYLEFYEQVVEDEVADAVFQRLTDPEWPSQKGYVALVDGEVMGFAHILLHPSTRSTDEDCFLEDLYIAPEVRGTGLGRALLQALVDQGCEVGWRRIHWLADADDEVAQRLYDELGTLTDQVGYRIDL